MKTVSRGSKRRRGAAVAAALVAAGAVVLAWPAGTWLQARELRPAPGTAADAVYLVAGAEDQPRRVEALKEYLAGAPGGCEVLVANDDQPGRWSSEDGRNLTVAEWAVREIESGAPAARREPRRGLKRPGPRRTLGPPVLSAGSSAAGRIRIVPGRFSGTDGEMQALSEFLATRADIRRLVVVTSPFHARRVVRRLRHYAGSVCAQVFVAVPAERWGDRNPWRVLVELAKMARDAAGLSRARFLSRGE